MKINEFNHQINQLIADTTTAAFGKASTPKKKHAIIHSLAFEDIMKNDVESMDDGKTFAQKVCNMCNTSCNTSCNTCNACNACNVRNV